VAASCLLLGPTRLPGGPGQLRKAVLIEEETAGLVLKVYFPGGSKPLAAPIPANSARVCLLRITVTEHISIKCTESFEAFSEELSRARRVQEVTSRPGDSE